MWMEGREVEVVSDLTNELMRKERTLEGRSGAIKWGPYMR